MSQYNPNRSFNLDRVEHLLNWLENPQKNFKSVLIAGTKGKGSTATVLSNILLTSQYRVGTYTSPHLETERERIQTNLKLSSQKDFIWGVKKIKSAFQKNKLSKKLGEVTYYEVFTILAFLIFAKNKIDIAVVEVGMGGRLDATNVLEPIVSVLSSISYDHMEQLGNTLTKIAKEKAAIIRNSGIVVSSYQEPEVINVLKKQVQLKKALWKLEGRDFSFSLKNISSAGMKFTYSLKGSKPLLLETKLIGEFQCENISLAITIGYDLKKLGFSKITTQNIRKAVKRVVWPGRFEIVTQKPWVVLDGAHNGESMRAFVQGIKKVFSKSTLLPIISLSEGKDLKRIWPELSRVTEKIIVTQTPQTRSAKALDLIKSLDHQFKQVSVASSLKQALTLAKIQATPKDVVMVTGSLFLVAEGKKLEKRDKELCLK